MAFKKCHNSRKTKFNQRPLGHILAFAFQVGAYDAICVGFKSR